MCGKRVFAVLGIMFFSFVAPPMSRAGDTPGTCSYTVAVWNVKKKAISKVQRISHPYSELAAHEIDEASGCTVCQEDQKVMKLEGLSRSFRVCGRLYPVIESTLKGLIKNGALIEKIRAYEVVMSRGEVDSEGNRTGLSNHSFGAAIDINRHLNGLYTDCVSFGPGCRLVLGGRWDPLVPGTLTPEGPIVKAMKSAGFKWGGEIPGRQKDFMHFSLTGY